MTVRMSSMQFMHNYKTSLNRTYQKQQQLFEQADGAKIHKGSDNPIAYTGLMRYRVTENENYQYGQNVDNAISWMKNSDSVIQNMTDNMKTFSEKTVQAANTYLSEADSKSIALEMKAIIDETMANCNHQLGDRYLFAGQKDTVQPFVMSDETFSRGLAKTLDAQQSAFFKSTPGNVASELYQMLTLDDGAGNTYYLDTVSGYVYDKKFVDEGYKNAVTLGYTTVNDEHAEGGTAGEYYAVGKMAEGFKVSDAFSNTGVVHTEVAEGEQLEFLTYKEDGADDDGNALYTVTGLNIYFKDDEDYSSDATALNFTTISQHIVNYRGDNNHISMVKMNGATDKNSDVVNITGQDMFGYDIFDDENSGNEQSGSAMLNEMLGVYEKVSAGDAHWLTSDGVTVSDVVHATITISETTTGSRLQLYTNVQDMLNNQSTIITEDITRVSGTDVAELATKLMELTTIYNLALSLGGRVLPQSLADYL